VRFILPSPLLPTRGIGGITDGSGIVHRQAEAEGRTFPHLTRNPYLPAVRFNNTLAEWKAKTDSRLAGSGRAAMPIEPVKDLVQDRGIDPLALVSDTDDNRIPGMRGLNSDWRVCGLNEPP